MTTDGQRETFGGAWTGGQWSFVRVLFAAIFLAGTIVMAATLVRTFGVQAVLPFFVQIVAAGLLLVGFGSRFPALLLLGFRVVRLLSSDVIDPGFELAIGLPLLMLVVAPQAPFGSLDARNRVDPDGGWRLPPWNFGLAWIAVALVGLLVSFRAVWTLKRADLSSDTDQVAFVGVMLAGFAFAGLAPFARTRRFAWAALWIGQIASCALDRQIEIMALRLVLPLFLFDPAWFPPRRASEPELVFFDGHCGLCHRLVRFLLGEDRARLFVFSTLQGEKIKKVLDEAARAQLPDSVVVRDFTGRVLVKSAAVVHVYDRLGGLWRVVALVLRGIPVPLRDFGYDFVALIRHKIFPRPSDSCPLMPPTLKDRFVA